MSKECCRASLDNSPSQTSGDSPRARLSALTKSKARLSRLAAPLKEAADVLFETGLDDETRTGELLILLMDGSCDAGIDAMSRALGGAVCLDVLTRRATGLDCCCCLCVCASPATGAARVKSVRRNAVKGLV